MLHETWKVLKSAALGFIDDSCLSRGAAIAYYTTFSVAPVLLIVIAVAALVFGEGAARGAVVDQISGVMGHQAADAIQAMLKGTARQHSGVLATVIGGVTLLIAASGVFGEVQTALNAIWKAEPSEGALRQLVMGRLRSLLLVLALGLLLVASLVATATLTAISTWFSARVPEVVSMLHWANFLVSFVLITLMFAAIYKVLPDTAIAWRDVGIGAVVTALLLAIGTNLTSRYIATSSVASTYGAAGAVGIVLVWVYYSAQIFLFGAEFTRAYAEEEGSRVGTGGVLAQASGHKAEIDRLKEQLEASHPARRPARSR